MKKLLTLLGVLACAPSLGAGGEASLGRAPLLSNVSITKVAPVEAPAVAVLMPEIADPFRAVFAQILEGIEKRIRGKVIVIRISGSTTQQEVAGEIRRQDARAVIALGRNGLRLAAGIDLTIPVIGGAIVNVPESETRAAAAISLAPDPAQLFLKLKSLSPATRRVHVVYDPEQSGWLVRLAREAARNQGFELVRYEVSDLKAAVRAYQDVFAASDPRRDAIWLPQDTVSAEESTVLPYVLEESWSRSIPMFSGSIAHVRRGALFSLYPNNVELGRRLGGLALGFAAGSGTKGLLPLQDVFTAANSRTANHLGLPLRDQNIDLVFPTP